MNLKIFSGSSNPPLVTRICERLGVQKGEIYLHSFPSGEKHCQIKENVRGSNVILIQSLSSPVNDNLMELLIMADAARRASAAQITAVCPYMGYMRSDRKVLSRTPIAAKLVINMMEAAGIQRFVTMDLHSGQAQAFTDYPFDNLYAFPLIIKYLKEKEIKDLVIVSPDLGGTKRAAALADSLGCEFACVIKKRLGDDEVKSRGIVGDVKGKNVLIIDDMTESLGTIITAAEACKEEGALEIRAAVTHGLMTKVAYDRLFEDKGSTLQELIVTDTVVQAGYTDLRIKVLDSSELFAKAIDSIHNNKSISELFTIKGF